MSLDSKPARMLFAGLPHLLAGTPAVVVLLLWWDRLPETLATRFDFAGTTTGTLGRPEVLGMTIAYGVGMGILFGARSGSGSGVRRNRGVSTRWLAALSWSTAGLIAPLLFSMVWSNIDAPDPSAVDMPSTALLSGVGVAALTGLIGFSLAPNDPVNDSKPTSQQLEIGPDEQICWRETIGAPWLAWVGSVLLAAGLLIGWTMDWSAGVATAGAGALVFLFLKCVVTVDRNGLTVSPAALRLLRIRIPLDAISRAETEETVPDQFLGLGYRIVRGGSGVILNHGPTLIVTRTSGRWFAVAVGDAATAAGVLNGLLVRRG